MTQAQTPPIAIVGVGCRFPKADGQEAYWHNIKNGLDAIAEIPETHWDPKDYFDEDKQAPDMTYAQRGGFLDPLDFDPLEFGITPNNLEATDTTHLMGLIAARDALRDAGYASAIKKNDGRQFDRDRCSVILGVTGTLELVIPLGARLGHPIWKKALKDAGVDDETAADVVKRISHEYVPWQENSFPGLLGNVAAGRIANRFDLGGTNCVVDAACASSLSALHLAVMELQAGRTDMAISGGVDTFNDIFMFMCFSKTPALSPSGNSKPFSADGDGTILGEGVGVVVLKRLEDAQRDNDKVYAVIRGIGSSSDGLGNAIYAPSAKGQSKALRNAYANAGVSPKDVELVEAHGTGTKVGDRIEMEALTNIYDETPNDLGNTWCAVGSVKSMIGHTKAAAGVASLIKAMLSLQNKVLPPSIKVDQPLDIIDPGTAPVYLNTEKRPWVKHHDHKRFAALSALGFGGSNFHCVLEEANPVKTHIDWDPQIGLIGLSAPSKEQLEQLCARSIQLIDKDTDLRAWAQKTRSDFNIDHSHRCVIAYDKSERLHIQSLLKTAQDHITSNTAARWTLPQGIFYSCEEAAGLGVLFPGQGSQRVAMLRDLACQFPELLESLEFANDAFEEKAYQERLSDCIYPIPVFDQEDRKRQSDKLRNTKRTQPALGAVSYGAWKILKRFELEADCFAGHSYGELVALCAAGAYDEATLHRISCKRGQLMADGDGDRGGMLAVMASMDLIEQVLKDNDWNIVVANKNAPEQCVLSGASSDIQEAAAYFSSNKISCKVLPVAAAFHSAFVSDSEEPFLAFLKEQKFSKPKHIVYANKTADVYKKTVASTQKTLASQLSNPVRFVEQIQSMYDNGISDFIEVGPGNVLSNLVDAILGEKPHRIIAIDQSKGSQHGVFDLAKAIAQLAAYGHDINLSHWDRDYQAKEQSSSKMAVRISGANYKTPRKAIPPRPVKTSDNKPSTNNSIPATSKSVEQPTVNTSAQQAALLQATQNSIQALQQMQENTALLHQQYLAAQEAAQQSVTQLLIQQQQLFNGESPNTFTKPAQIPAIAKQQIQPQPPQEFSAPASSAPVRPKVPEQAPLAQQSSTDVDGSTNRQIQQALIHIVSDKTGYPENMLDVNMSLDADLGIDSIKRVEILSALQDAFPELPQIDADMVGQLETLQDIVAACSDISLQEPSTTSQSAAPVTQLESKISQLLLGIVADKTGYPIEMLEPSMHLDADLGIDSIKRVEILSALQEQAPDLPNIAAEDMGSLQSLNDIILYLDSNNTEASTAQIPQTIKQADDTIAELLIDIVAEKTGYPKDMLQLNMSMDADLGIDSIKRVEILSALQEKDAKLPSINAEDMGQLQTLQDIVDQCQSIGQSEQKAPVQGMSQSNSSLNDIEHLSQGLLSIVAEKTGYPLEMLQLEMQLDADLGIDSIKRVEILSALQEQYPTLPNVDADDMGSLHSLQDIVQYLDRGTPVEQTHLKVETISKNDIDTLGLTEALISIVAEKTGYPIDMLDVNMQLDADLGIDSIKRVEILSALQEQIPHAPVVQADEIGHIQTLKDIIDHICSIDDHTEHIDSAAVEDTSQAGLVKSIKRMPLSAQELDQFRRHIHLDENSYCVIMSDGSGLAESLSSALPCQCEIISDSASDIKKLDTLIIIAQSSFTESELLKRFNILQKLIQGLADNNGNLIAITQCGDRFGHKESCLEPLTAAWSGIVKTAQHEFPSLHCKVIDWDANTSIEKLAEEIHFNGPLEVSLQQDGLWTCALNNEPVPSLEHTPIQKSDNIIVTGGARGVTADVAISLAKRFGCNLILLGRSPLPEKEASYLKNCHDESSIKQALIKHWVDGTPTPKIINQQTTRILADRAIRANMAAMKSMGVNVSYYSLDVRNANAVKQCIDQIRNEWGSIDGIIHGAGVLADKHLIEKTNEQFSSVWQTKVDGAVNLLNACQDDTLKCLVLFSSSTARYGRTGQCDYAAANEVLNKLAQQYRVQHPNCKVLSINWGPWDGGMVNKELKQLFKQEGIDVIDCKLGAEYLCDELSVVNGPCEIVLLGDEQSGRDTTDKRSAQPCTHIAYEFTLSVETHPVLKSHVMNNKAVLPAAIIMEWLAHAAIHENPGLQLHGLTDFSVFKGVIINEAEKHQLSFHISETEWDNGIGYCTVAMQHDDTLHARAIVSLADDYADEPASELPQAQGKAPSGNPYEDARLFHGADLQGLLEVNACDSKGIVCKSMPAPSADHWIKQAMRKQWYADPLAIDTAFQAMIIWSHAIWNSASLPTRFGSYQQFVERFPNNPIQIIARVNQSQKHRAVADIEFLNEDGSLLARIIDYECVIDESLGKSFQQNKLGKEVKS